MQEKKGYVSFVLHAHLPFIHHPESDDYLEESWLYEAISETYIPLLTNFQKLVDEGVNFRITMSMTPPLLSMLDNKLLQKKYINYLKKLIELSEVEILIMKSIWKLGDGITVYEIIDYLDQVYDRKYARSTVKTYITKLKKKGFVDTQVKGNYSYITAKITEKMYREEQMELMKDFWHDGSMKELVQTLTHTISKEEKEELKDLINDLDD